MNIAICVEFLKKETHKYLKQFTTDSLHIIFDVFLYDY